MKASVRQAAGWVTDSGARVVGLLHILAVLQALIHLLLCLAAQCTRRFCACMAVQV